MFDSKDLSSGMNSPPSTFVESHTLTAIKALLRQHGMFKCIYIYIYIYIYTVVLLLKDHSIVHDRSGVSREVVFNQGGGVA